MIDYATFSKFAYFFVDMKSIQEIQYIIAPELETLNRQIRESLGTGNPLMNQVVDGFLRSKGKQIRPMVVLLTAKMFASSNSKAISAAVAVELLHSASLIHDDVVDNAKIRRNRPTVNAIWDNHIAVLVGDFFVSNAMQQAISTADVRIIDALCYLGKLLSLGELDQIYNARYHKLTEEAYFHIISYKTASLFVACAKMGCYAVDVCDSDIEAVARFAELLGLCFQIRDDIFDYYSDEKVGKPTGNDLKEGKITLPLLHVLLDETAPHHEEMLALSRKEELSDDEIAALTAYAVDNGGIDYAYAKMAELRDEGAQILASLPDTAAKSAMFDLFDNIIARDY